MSLQTPTADSPTRVETHGLDVIPADERHWPGVIALVGATVVAVLSANTTLYQGPIVVLLNGADLSALLGPLVAGAVYALLWRRTRPYSDPRLRPEARPDRTLESTLEAVGS